MQRKKSADGKELVTSLWLKSPIVEVYLKEDSIFLVSNFSFSIKTTLCSLLVPFLIRTQNYLNL